MEPSSLTMGASTSGVVARRTPSLRLQRDERLVALIREGHPRAFEVLFNRYQSRLLAFCRRMVGSPQDAEDVLQEVFAAAHSAILADSRPINARPWLYRIARNKCVNHLRKPTAEGVDSMDVHPHENGTSTLEQVQRREELRAIVSDVHELPKTQRTALTLRAIDDLSYTDIAQKMGTTLPSVKSLLVRARMSLAESIEARGALAPLRAAGAAAEADPRKARRQLGCRRRCGGAAGSARRRGERRGHRARRRLSAKAAVGVTTAALLAAGAVGVSEMNLGGQHSKPSAAKPGVSATAAQTRGIGSSAKIGSPAKSPRAATSPRAGRRAAADTARARGSTASTGSGGGGGSTTGRPPVEHAPPVAPPPNRRSPRSLRPPPAA